MCNRGIEFITIDCENRTAFKTDTGKTNTGETKHEKRDFDLTPVENFDDGDVHD